MILKFRSWRCPWLGVLNLDSDPYPGSKISKELGDCSGLTGLTAHPGNWSMKRVPSVHVAHWIQKSSEGLGLAGFGHCEVFFSFCSDAQLNYFPLWIAGSTLGTGLFAVPLIAMTDSPVEARAPRDDAVELLDGLCRSFLVRPDS